MGCPPQTRLSRRVHSRQRGPRRQWLERTLLRACGGSNRTIWRGYGRHSWSLRAVGGLREPGPRPGITEVRSEQRSAAERESPITVVGVDDKHLIRSALGPCQLGGCPETGTAGSQRRSGLRCRKWPDRTIRTVTTRSDRTTGQRAPGTPWSCRLSCGSTRTVGRLLRTQAGQRGSLQIRPGAELRPGGPITDHRRARRRRAPDPCGAPASPVG